jgi:hypothetical protein
MCVKVLEGGEIREKGQGDQEIECLGSIINVKSIG